MNGLVNWATARARMILAFVIFSVTAGVAAYVGLPKEGEPNLDVPALYISTPLPGASAADVENLVIKPLETELRDLEGLKTLTGIATEGHGGVFMEFQFGWDKAAIIAETRDRVSRAESEMPSEVEEPTVNEINLSQFPVLVVTLSGAAPERTLTQAARVLQREIESLPSVVEVALAGVRDETIEIVVDPARLEAYELSVLELVQVVNNNNQLVPAGALETGSGRFSISVPGNFQTAEELLSVVIKSNGDRVVTLGDVADVRSTFEDPAGRARYNGEQTIALQIKKRTGENIIETVAAVRERVALVQAQWPETLAAAVTVDFSMDQSVQVESMVDQLEASVLTAILLVMIVVLAALGLRSAFLVGLAVPCSFLLAFALFGALGYSVNNMVMFGLILAVGMLVDGAIVVAEFADRRMEEGVEPVEAYSEAARRMFWPIVSSTATTLCAFLPMLFWPGMPGQFMSFLPITLIFVLSASLLVALIYLPVLGGIFGALFAWIGRGAARIGLAPKARRRAPELVRRPSLFGRFIQLIVGNPVGPFVALGVAAGLIFGVFTYYGQNNAGTEFFVETEPERAILFVRARGNLSLETRDQLVAEVERRVLEVDGLSSVFAFSGEGGLERIGVEGPADTIGQVQIELAPWRGRLFRDDPLTGDEVLAAIAERTADIPGVIVEIAEENPGPQQGKPLQLLIATNNEAQLLALTVAARARFDGDVELVDVDDTRPLPGLEWLFEVDRAAAGRLGVDVAQIGGVMQLLTRGFELDQITRDDSEEQIDIIARFPAVSRTLAAFDSVRIQTAAGLTPLSHFVDVRAEPNIGQITRRDGRRFFVVRADVATDVNVNAKIEEITEWLDAQREAEPALWAGARVEFIGDQQEQAESQAFLAQAFIAALALMFVILLAQFNSLYNSVLVLSAVVMSTAGVLIGMLVMNQPFSVIMTGTGVVALAGIVVNNNIVLIDTYQEHAKVMPRLAAIRRTAEDRLRPVLLTTITTMAGLFPMVFATSIDFFNREISVGAPTALWWIPLATAVVFGLGFATLLTLVVTPAALAARVWTERGASAAAGLAWRAVRGDALRREAQDRALARRLSRAGAVTVDWTSVVDWGTGDAGSDARSRAEVAAAQTETTSKTPPDGVRVAAE